MSDLKDSLRKDEQSTILGGGKYEVDFSDMDRAAVEQAVEQLNQRFRKREMTVDQYEKALNRMDDDEVEIDFSDIEKDIAELEMNDVEIFVEDEAEEPAIKPETGGEWD
jgi:hypothetical protein